MKKRIFLHIGAHKTASTLIQTFLLDKRNSSKISPAKPILISQHHGDENYIAFRAEYTALKNDILWKLHNNLPIPDKLIDATALVIKRFIDGKDGEHIVWSDENILGNAPGHPSGRVKVFTPGLYPASQHLASAFHQALADHQLSVRLYSREPKSLVRSLYSDWILKLREPTTLPDFELKVPHDSFDWSAAARPWAEKFGNSVSMLAFEGMRVNPEAFLAEFLEWAKLEFYDLERLKNPPNSNSSLTERQITVALFLIDIIRPHERDLTRNFIRGLK